LIIFQNRLVTLVKKPEAIIFRQQFGGSLIKDNRRFCRHLAAQLIQFSLQAPLDLSLFPLKHLHVH
jgi:hypothetical protein